MATSKSYSPSHSREIKVDTGAALGDSSKEVEKAGAIIVVDVVVEET